MKNKRIGLFLIIAVVISLLSITIIKAADLSTDIINARNNPTDLINYSGVNIDTKLPQEYNFRLGKNDSVDVEYSGYQTVPNNIKTAWGEKWGSVHQNATPSLAVDSIKGRYSVLYKGVDYYNGELIDVKATVLDFAPQQTTTSSPVITLVGDNIGNHVLGVIWIKIKFEFFKSGTTQPVVVKGNTTYWDVDGHQGVIMHDNNKGLYATNNNVLKVSSIGGKPYIFDAGTGANDYETPQNAFTETFEGSSLTRTYQYGNPDNSPWEGTQGVIILHSATPVTPDPLPVPTKSVNKEQVDMGEEYTYTIKQQVYSLINNSYYKSFKIEDTLESVLELNSSNISIKNESGTDVTSNFNITVNGQKITVTPNNLNNSSFYGHTYTISIKTKIKEDADLSTYRSGEYFVIPNKATTTYTDADNENHVSETEEANVKTKGPDYSLTVHHYEEDTNLKLAEDVTSTKKYGDSYTTSAATVPEGYELVSTPTNASGTITGNTEVIYYYKLKDLTLTVHHYEEDTNLPLVDDVISTKKYGSNYTTSPATVPEGYEVVSTPPNASGTITENTEVTYYYKLKSLTLTVHHYKQGTTEELVPKEVTTKTYGESYTTSKSNMVSSDYELVSTPPNASGTITENTEVNYYYKLKEATLKVRHLEDGTHTVLAPEQTSTVYYGNEYETTASESIPQNYILKTTPDNYRGVVSNDEIVVTYYYQKKDANIVPTISKDGTETITDKNSKIEYQINYQIDFTDYIEETIITLTDKLPYEIDETESNLDGGTYNADNNTIIWTENVNINSYENPSKTITKNLVIKYKNIDPKKRTITNTITGNVKGDNKNITVEDNHNTNVIITGNITVRYIDKETEKDLLDIIKTTGLVGDKYNLPQDQDIQGYKLVSKPDEEKYEYKETDQELKYYYEKIKLKVETKVKGNGGSIEGDETVYYGEDSTKNKIKIVASDNYYIDKIWINGKQIDVPENCTTMTLPNFTNMLEDKLVEVSFKGNSVETVKVPSTSASIPVIISLLGIILTIGSSVLIYNKVRKKA